MSERTLPLLFPMIFDDWRDLGLNELAHAFDDCPLLRIERVGDSAEVAIGRERRTLLLWLSPGLRRSAPPCSRSS
jgi:hypothetical protein